MDTQNTESAEKEKGIWSERWKAHSKEWKTTLDELEVQLALGKKEAADKFEELKDRFRKTVNERKSKLETASGVDWDEVKGDFEHLEVQLALGKAELKDAYVEQRDKILTAIDKAKRSLKNSIGDGDEDFLDIADDFRARLEAYQVQFALGKYEARDALEEKKQELRALVQEFRQKLNELDDSDIDESDEDKFDQMMGELSNSFDHLKKAFTVLFD